MPHGKFEYRGVKPIDIMVCGFDRPEELYCITEGVRLVFVGYRDQVDSNLSNWPLGQVFKYELVERQRGFLMENSVGKEGVCRGRDKCKIAAGPECAWCWTCGWNEEPGGGCSGGEY